MDPARYPVWALVLQARRQARLTQRELARRAGTSQAAVARYERAQVMPDIPTLFRLVRACGYDLRLELQPVDGHDAALIGEHLLLTPTQRAEGNRRATRAMASAARDRRRSPAHRA